MAKKNPRTWTWKEAEAYRRQKELPLDYYLHKLNMSKAMYGVLVAEGCSKNEHKLKLDRYKRYMNLYSLDEGNRLLTVLDKYVSLMVKRRHGLTKKAWYKNCGLGYNAASIKQQIRHSNSITFQQVVDIMGKLGYTIVVVDTANKRVDLPIKNEEYDKVKRRELGQEE